MGGRVCIIGKPMLGEMERESHRRKPWKRTGGDTVRAAISGQTFGFKVCMMYQKQDMMEFVTSFGFPSVLDRTSPCPCCCATADDMYNLVGISLDGLPWGPNDYATYDHACSQCERWVWIMTDALYQRVRAVLDYDSRDSGYRGRTLLVAIPELGLKKNFRLEPHPGMPNVADFDHAVALIRVLFWDRSRETKARHRNPIYNEETDMIPSKVIVPDWLHSLALGCYKVFISLFFHRLFHVNAFGIAAGAKDAIIRESVMRIKERLFQWYGKEAEEGREHGRVQNLTAEMVGDSEKHMISTWGHETNGVLEFCPTLWESFGTFLPRAESQHFKRALDSILGIHAFIKTYRGGDASVWAKQDASRTNINLN